MVFFGVAKVDEPAIEHEECVSYTYHNNDAKSHDLAYFIYSSTTSFLIPLLTIIGAYTIIICVLKRKRNETPSQITGVSTGNGNNGNGFYSIMDSFPY